MICQATTKCHDHHLSGSFSFHHENKVRELLSCATVSRAFPTPTLHFQMVQVKGFPLLQYKSGSRISQEVMLELRGHLCLSQIPFPPGNLPPPKQVAHSPILLRF